jgi:hypothetical protein
MRSHKCVRAQQILSRKSSVADPGCLSRIPDPGSDFFPSWIPDPNFFHPGSRIHIKDFKYLNPKNGFLSSWKYEPGCSSWIRIRDPDPDFVPIPDPGSGSATLRKSVKRPVGGEQETLEGRVGRSPERVLQVVTRAVVAPKQGTVNIKTYFIQHTFKKICTLCILKSLFSL